MVPSCALTDSDRGAGRLGTVTGWWEHPTGPMSRMTSREMMMGCVDCTLSRRFTPGTLKSTPKLRTHMGYGQEAMGKRDEFGVVTDDD